MTDNQKPIALEERIAAEDRLQSPSAARNRDIIRDTFIQHMPTMGQILEVGSGTGEHAVHVLAALPGLIWQPSDPDEASRRSIAAWAADKGLQKRLLAPLDLQLNQDGAQPGDFESESFKGPLDGVVSINMIHIAPFSAAQGLIATAGRCLKPGGRLFLYGPFARDGAHTSPSNEAFDASLKSRDAGWGVRDLDREIAPLAEEAGLSFQTAVPMPANNFSVIFARQ